MPVMNVKKDGQWQDIASTYKHTHTSSDITDLPADTADVLASLQEKVGADSVAYQINTAVQASQYVHPATHSVEMITGLSDVAISGDYNDLKNLPEQVQADWIQDDETKADYIKNKPEIPEEYVHPETHPASMIEGLATVATSGSYNDLSNKPVIPSIAGLATTTYVDNQIASLGEVTEQVQADWLETDTTSPAYIKNKPSISVGGGSGDGGSSIPMPSTAKAGQYLQISGVDENGVISSMSTVDTAASDWDTMKNKPFYEYEGLVDIRPSVQYDNFKLHSTYGIYYVDKIEDYALAIGETYIVYWDGIEYECVAQDGSQLLSGSVLLGNVADFGLSGNNEPFIIGNIGNQGSQYFSLTDQEAGGSHTVRITQEEVITKQLDEKYSPVLKYVEPVEVDVLPLTQFDDFQLNQEFGVYMSVNSDIALELTVGQTYTVSWDGEDYKCVAQDGTAVMGVPCTFLGNATNFGLSGNDEPFIVAYDGFSTMCVSLTDTEAGRSHTVRVVQISDGYYILKDKYVELPDWNENDESSRAYIKNKPFGITPAGTVIIEETTVNCQIGFDGNLYCALINQLDIGTFAYDVKFDGVDYQIIGEEDSNGMIGIVYVTDALTFGIIKNFNGTGHNVIMSTQGEHTVKITLAEDVVIKIDEKYIPEIDGLPPVSTEDNNKIMTVVNGVWVAQTPASGLPEVSTDDNDKVLKVVDGAWVVDTITHPMELPTVSTDDNDKVLTVVDGAWSASTIIHPIELPTVTIDDAGKFLRVGTDGTWIVETIQDVSEVGL